MKIIKTFILAGMLFAISSCISTSNEITENDKLTPEEYQQLVKKCRIFVITSPRLKNMALSDENKRFINTHEPKFNAHYYGHKSGEFHMVWLINPGFSVRVIGRGEFLASSCKLRLSISRFVQQPQGHDE